MDNYGYNDWRSYLAHSLELRHSWGTKPEQKAREKEYNHEYWEKNKERIMAQRRKHKDKDYSGEYFKKNDEGGSSDKADIDSEVSALEALIKKNASMGGYDNAAMENIRQHNQNIIDNITALQEKINEYLTGHPDLSDAQRAQVMESFKTQVDKAMDFAIDLSKESSRDYLSDIGIKPNGSSGKKKKSSGGRASSSGSSSSGSGGSSSGSSSKKTGSTGSKSGGIRGKKALASQGRAYDAERYYSTTKKNETRMLDSQRRAYEQEREDRKR